MTTTQHTPGPWFADDQKVRAEIDHVLIAGCSVRDLETSECQANARLIAAAPETKQQRDELLEALQQARGYVTDTLVLELIDFALDRSNGVHS